MGWRISLYRLPKQTADKWNSITEEQYHTDEVWEKMYDEWSARLKEAPTLGCREKERIADEYVTAIAKELLKNQMRKQ